jgi:hypothetical protein
LFEAEAFFNGSKVESYLSRPSKWRKSREEDQEQSKEEMPWKKRCQPLVK